MDFREWYEQDGCHYMASEASLMSTMPKIKADAIRDALPHGLTESGLSMQALLDYADEIESGEE